MNFTFQARIIVLEIVGQKTIPVFSLWQYHCTDSKELLLVTVGILSAQIGTVERLSAQ